jgi:hypothetical protein
MEERLSFSVWTDVWPEPGQPDGRHRYAEVFEEARLADSLPFRAFCTTASMTAIYPHS